ncbi:MAG: hypothetical protein HY698_15910 [Deltaproteobacteria bacterium]|nr:hypothetical protein [Deltaproteobacteria bacterium]
MGKGDSRRTLKMRRRKSQRKLKDRIARKIAVAKAAKPGGSTGKSSAAHAAPKRKAKKAE